MSTRLRKQTTIKASSGRRGRSQAGGRARVHSPATPRNILMPVDFSAESTGALKYAGTVARKRGAEVILLHVVDWIHYVHDFGYGHVNRRRTNDPAVRSAGVRLRALGRRHYGSGQPWAAVVRTGTVCEEITKVALEMNSEMIVMPAHGRVRVTQSRSGNVATRVMHQSPCPVLTLSEPLLARSRQNQASL